jgi:N,N'-diacetyllegionaminate synthase
MLRRLELTESMHRDLVTHCASQNIGFFSTGFDVESVDLLLGLGQELFKIPSGEITNLPYLRHVGKLGKPTILSTGMSSMDEIEAAINVLEISGTHRSKITVLQCTSAYPTPMSDVNLRAMQNIQNRFNVSVGYSDHTLGIEAPIAAVALGATVIEKHFTTDRSLPGPDHKASLEPSELKAMVKGIRNIEAALGDGEKRLMPSEATNIAVGRRSIVAKCPIEKGEVFSAFNLTAKRSGVGLSPMRWDDIIGTHAKRDYVRDEIIEL